MLHYMNREEISCRRTYSGITQRKSLFLDPLADKRLRPSATQAER